MQQAGAERRTSSREWRASAGQQVFAGLHRRNLNLQGRVAPLSSQARIKQGDCGALSGRHRHGWGKIGGGAAAAELCRLLERLPGTG